MTIMIVNPNTTAAMTDAVLEGARGVADPRTELIGSTADTGVSSIESNVDEVWGSVAVLEQVSRGEQRGVDGYVIACFGDTGVHAARELARGPVVGMTEAALFTAAIVAARFTVITLPASTREQSQRVLRETGLGHRATIRAIDVPVLDAAADATALLEPIAAQALEALRDDAAEAIVLGCAGLAELGKPLSDRIGAPVIEGVAAAVTMVEGLISQGLSASRVGTYRPSEHVGVTGS
jgi:allantoin racemase